VLIYLNHKQGGGKNSLETDREGDLRFEGGNESRLGKSRLYPVFSDRQDEGGSLQKAGVLCKRRSRLERVKDNLV